VQPPTDWLSSPDPRLSDWPIDTLDAAAAYASSPVLPPGVLPPEREDAWNYFNSYFQQESQQSLLASPTNEMELAQQASQAANVSHATLPLINTPQTSMAQDEDGNSDMTDEAFHPNGSLSPETSESSLQNSFKAAWGTSKIPLESSNPGRNSSCIKEKRNKSSHRESPPSSPNSHQLRGVRARPRMKVENDAEAEGEPLSRVSHNMVEKQYRNRLNTQFTNLLDSLPPELIRAQFDGHVDSGGRGAKVSKGDVLVFAKRYIQTLEQEKKSLEGDRAEREGELRGLREAWARMGGKPLV